MGFEEMEAAGKHVLEQFPLAKRAAKRVYQATSIAMSKGRIMFEGNITRVTPNDGREYFYGYYDKSPWDADDHYILVNRVQHAYASVAPSEPCVICLIDTKENNRIIKVATSDSWNVQQGCMAQWLGPDYRSRIIYNDFRDGSYCSVIFNVNHMTEERVLPLPIYDVAHDGSFALSLDFSRLHRLRPGYGYSNIPDLTKGMLCPDECCVWKIKLSNAEVTELFKYTDLSSFENNKSMEGAEHKVNHLMISPSGERFMLLHRWLQKGRKHTRLVTSNIDGSGLYNLSDDVFVSHCFWKNDEEILSFCRKRQEGNRYYLMKDRTHEYTALWPNLRTDGHCSYNSSGQLVVTDTYPNRTRMASVYICSEESNWSKEIARVYSPFKYDNDCRCDLHPRWNRTGDGICIDSIHEGRRNLYICQLNSNNTEEIDQQGKSICFVITSYRNTGPMNQTYYLARGLRERGHNVTVISVLREKDGDSVKDKFDVMGIRQIGLGLSREESILLGKTRLRQTLQSIRPDIIHAVGMPLFRMVKNYKQARSLTVIRNYCREDYPAKYGPNLGSIMADRDIRLIKNMATSNPPFVTCSKSLSEIYKDKEGIILPHIANGVDVERFKPKSSSERSDLRTRLGITDEDIVITYAGQFNSRKNQRYAIEVFLGAGFDKNVKLLLLGDGPLRTTLMNEYSEYHNIIFGGSVQDMPLYLSASDLYITTSKSEGMPNGVLEAMACGLPVAMSDIPQHREIIENQDQVFGFLFSLKDVQTAAQRLKSIAESDCAHLGLESRSWVVERYSSEAMVNKYVSWYGL